MRCNRSDLRFTVYVDYATFNSKIVCPTNLPRRTNRNSYRRGVRTWFDPFAGSDFGEEFMAQDALPKFEEVICR